ncbi:MAG: class I SAM-dependent RNA methyltransferase [Deltaproteobacteria bacterium]|nr:class I SAM-dependent RNA methyltransferase [Deltaproteobacteria bacterium]
MSRRKVSNRKIEIQIDSLAPGGDGAGIYGEKICFVKGAAPGDRLIVNVEKEEKKAFFCTIDKIVEPGLCRIEPECSVFNRCGGCQWQHISYDKQAEEKKYILERNFNLHNIEFVKSNTCFGYRRLARLHFKILKNGKSEIGFFRERAHMIEDIHECPVLKEQLSECIDIIRESLFFEENENQGELILSTGFDDNNKGVWLYIRAEKKLKQKVLLSDFFKGVTGNIEGVEVDIAGDQAIRSTIFNNVNLLMPPGSFGQANSYINGQLIKKIIEVIKLISPVESCVEFFSGAGNFSVFIARLVKKLDCVELDGMACRLALDNCKNEGLNNVNVHQNRSELMPDSFFLKRDLIILDPPRTGNSVLAEKIAKSGVKNIIYVSCNPKTLKRDGEILIKNGFKLQFLTGFDMFPQTPHIESLAFYTPTQSE